MKIILAAKSVYPFHPVGGVQKYVYYFAKHLAKRGIHPEIVAPLDHGRPRTEEHDGLTYTFLKPAIYRYLEYPVGWLGVHVFSRALNEYLQSVDFDLLHSFDLTGYQYVKNKNRRPVIAHVFTDNFLCNPVSLNPFEVLNFTGSRFDRIKEEKVKISPFDTGMKKWKYAVQYFLKIRPMHACLKLSEAVFYEADVYRSEMDAFYRLDPGKSDVIPVGTDISCIDEVRQSSACSREDIGFSGSDIVLITVNRLAADKGVDKIVLALDKIKNVIPSIKLIIVGSGYQEREIRKIIKERNLSNRVYHVKNIPESRLYGYYRLADIYISAFSYPGSSISTLEAMACSLPVITTAQPWLVHNGTNGRIIPSNRPEVIQEAVVQLVKDGRLKEKGKVSREAVKNFDWEEIASRACARYEKVLSR